MTVSNIITYLMIGVAFNFILDVLSNLLDSDNKLKSKEKILVTLIWPLALLIFAYHFIKTYTNDPD